MKPDIIISLLFSTLVLFSMGCSPIYKSSQPLPGQHPQSFETEIRKSIKVNYLLYLPENYADAKEKWPLMLFLHGAGERGDDLDKVKTHGPPKLIAEEKRQFPFVIVSPQCPEDGWWTAETQIDQLNALLDDIVSRYRIDKERIYVTGLSMGGFGTWSLAMAYPDRFAAIAPICGGGNPKNVARISHIPTWVFHGAKDRTVPLSQSEEMVNALKEAGSNVKFTIYPDAGHDSWTDTYNNPELYTWFLMHKRTDKR